MISHIALLLQRHILTFSKTETGAVKLGSSVDFETANDY